MLREKVLRAGIAGCVSLLLCFGLMTERKGEEKDAGLSIPSDSGEQAKRFNPELKFLRSIGQHIISTTR